MNPEVPSTAPEPPKTAFKVIEGDQSCSGGRHTWSLPQRRHTWSLPQPGGKPGEWTPGDWHVMATDPGSDGPGSPLLPLLCQFGFHLTQRPARWYSPNRTVYLAEYGGPIDGPREDNSEDPTKIAVMKVRLVRPLTPHELADHGIYTEGKHTCTRPHDQRSWATGSAQVTATGSAQVTATDSAQVTATGSAQVTATDSAQVTATGSAQVKAYDSAQVTAYGSAQVTATGSAQVTAYGSAQVTAYDSAQVTAYGSAQVTAYDSAQVTAYDSAQVTAYGSAQVKAEGKSTILKQSFRAAVKLFGLAVEVDWTKERAEFRRAEPIPDPAQADPAQAPAA